jgi:hypothetical protein
VRNDAAVCHPLSVRHNLINRVHAVVEAKVSLESSQKFANGPLWFRGFPQSLKANPGTVSLKKATIASFKILP